MYYYFLNSCRYFSNKLGDIICYVENLGFLCCHFRRETRSVAGGKTFCGNFNVSLKNSSFTVLPQQQSKKLKMGLQKEIPIRRAFPVERCIVVFGAMIMLDESFPPTGCCRLSTSFFRRVRTFTKLHRLRNSKVNQVAL